MNQCERKGFGNKFNKKKKKKKKKPQRKYPLVSFFWLTDIENRAGAIRLVYLY